MHLHPARSWRHCQPQFSTVWSLQGSHHGAQMQRIQAFLNENNVHTPCLIIDLDQVRRNYDELQRLLPRMSVFYAVKANPAPEVIRTLVEAGSSFDVASVPEINLCLELGATPARLSYGSTIKKERDISYAYSRGIRLFAFDSEEELLKISRAAPGSLVFCRLAVRNDGALCPLHAKFGCSQTMAEDLMRLARHVGLVPYGASFHVGSQQTCVGQWDAALSRVKSLLATLQEHSIDLQAVNLGGGLPAQGYADAVPAVSEYTDAINRAIVGHFGARNALLLMIEPGRAIVADAGVLQAEVVLVARKSNDDCKRWVYLDAGRFNGLAETLDEAIAYNITTSRDGEETEPVILAGPTCDSVDVIYEKKEYSLPVGLRAGDLVQFHSTGAYTASYASVAFNGFPPIQTYCI
ncbi:Ornithine/DAP/Arg decarboxylase [Carpediemonas membranifera]|uniref:ornithine decarboxylase n=1 Tax=Carpediemonas membranifera TaxID=201153 RepID=A0A8J6E1Z5_9EUKA|nr:Ornithine/DAP/Arg decarboxylase [Carpediemonas membranifera]|eukprot:KAG9391267.1 Ornithine/DAP/Arg decarboxylase [Carpediemonas membranifera]